MEVRVRSRPMATAVSGSTSILGNAVLRTEDPAVLRGESRYLADLEFDGADVAFVRATVAHARLTSIETAVAAAMPGVRAVRTAADLPLTPYRMMDMVPEAFGRAPLASGTVRFVGE